MKLYFFVFPFFVARVFIFMSFALSSMKPMHVVISFSLLLLFVALMLSLLFFCNIVCRFEQKIMIDLDVCKRVYWVPTNSRQYCCDLDDIENETRRRKKKKKWTMLALNAQFYTQSLSWTIERSNEQEQIRRQRWRCCSHKAFTRQRRRRRKRDGKNDLQ